MKNGACFHVDVSQALREARRPWLKSVLSAIPAAGAVEVPQDSCLLGDPVAIDTPQNSGTGVKRRYVTWRVGSGSLLTPCL